MKKYRLKYERTHKKAIKRRADLWVKRNPEKRKEVGIRHRLKRLGLSVEEIDKAIDASKRKNKTCPICGATKLPSKQWHADHCHDMKIFRDILCFRCNSMLGMAHDNIVVLQKAIQYLNKFRRAIDD